MIPAFLSKTYAIMHNDDFKDMVCWGENGESILILKVGIVVLSSDGFRRSMIFPRKSFLCISNMATSLPLCGSLTCTGFTKRDKVWFGGGRDA